ncbi:phosphomannomutase/phosphoglucomutase [Maricurvus nonylphenolicus]|uniref:phosphomannomutase/phosphoglucomutase n=1 Tax=Maricurvus nonylphenolicus TaxID=1008307 RepID=UPI0036F4312F
MIATSKASATQAPKPVITLAAMALVTVICLGLGYFSYSTLISDEETRVLNQLGHQQAELRAQTVERFIDTQQQQLNLFASRESMANVVSNPTPELLKTVKSSLLKAFPETLSLRLFSLGRKELISGTDMTPSFVELDMINRAERRQPVSPEAIRADNKLQLMFIAPIAVSQEASPVGSLLIALPINALQTELQQQDVHLGQTQVLQQVSFGKPITIVSLGQAHSAESFESNIDNTNWQIKFSPSGVLIEQASQSPLLVVMATLGISTLLLGLCFWLCRRFDPAWQAASASHQKVVSSRLEAIESEGETAEHIANPMFHNQDILDIDVAEEDQDLLSLEEARRQQSGEFAEDASPDMATPVPGNIFRAYDIRGIVGDEITPDLSRLIGQAIGSEAIAQGESAIFVARDGRTHGPELSAALVEGIVSSGCDVIDLGAVPTPLLYFATCEEPDSNSGVMLTASHNPAEYNGFKVVINGVTLADDDIQALRSRIERNDFNSGSGEIEQRDILPAYIDRIFSDVALAGDVKVVIDAGNGITGNVAPQLFEELGCEVIPLYCEVDGSFPNHEADPSREENLADLIAKVKETGADLGIALDGDGDRIGVVTSSGEIIWPDRLLMLFAKDIVTGHPGCDVLFDVKSTRELNNLVSSYGGRPIMWKTGHSHMKAKMQETGALLGGELSGHIFIKERWYGFDDGMYAGTRLLEIMTLRDQSLDDIFASFPALPATPELKIDVPEESKFSLIDQLAKQADFSSGKVTTLDGIRVDFAKGWGLVRASNTSPCLTLRFEGETEEVVEHLQQVFKRELHKIDSSLSFPF